jgi:hypothetical protein
MPQPPDPDRVAVLAVDVGAVEADGKGECWRISRDRPVRPGIHSGANSSNP